MKKTIYAVYRVLYGEDFIKESILSMLDHVDKVFILWTDKIWGKVTQVNYGGEIIQFPKKFDNILEKIKEIKSDKIIIEPQGDHWVDVPWNATTILFNEIVLKKYPKPDILVLPEPDHVFAENDFKVALNMFINRNYQFAKTGNIELWKSPKYQIPNSPNKVGTVFWNMRNFATLPVTRGNGQPVINSIPHVLLPIKIYNLGFMVSDKSMYWKHLTAIAFSKIIKDSPPNPAWYEQKWLRWDFHNNNKNLHMSIGYERLIPKIVEHKNCRLPKSILNRYKEDI